MAIKTKMKCPVCGGEAILSKQNLKLFRGAISLKDNYVYVCKNCNEKFATGEMTGKALNQAKQYFKFNRKLISTGGSIAITLPSDLSDYYKLKKGEQVQIIPQSKKEMKIVIL